MRWEGSGGSTGVPGDRAFYRVRCWSPAWPWPAPLSPLGVSDLHAFPLLHVDLLGWGRLAASKSTFTVIFLPPASSLLLSQASSWLLVVDLQFQCFLILQALVCFLGSPGTFTSLPKFLPMVLPLPFGHYFSISGWLPLGTSLPCIWVQKWRRFGAVLYRQSGCALARLELQEGPEKLRRGEAARRVIRLSDCLRVTEANGEASSPRDTSAFFLETKDRLYLLATPTAERSNWMQAICLLAFPGQRKELSGSEGKGSQPCMEENELYSSSTTVAPSKEFAVTVRPTEASDRCRLRGSYTLRTGESALELWGGPEPRTHFYSWPYRFLRRFGRDKITFSFEAGRRCVSGEGNFEFETRQGNEIFLALEEAISAQKHSVPPGPQTQPAPAPAPTVLPQLESPYSQPHDSLPPPSPAGRVARSQLRGPEGEYAVPFDAVGRNLGKSLKGILVVPPQPPTDPLYDSIQERPPSRPDHIYDEPEGVAVLSLYDSPQEPLRDAWRRQATGDGDPSDLQHIYPVGQDFPASSWPQGTEYDNVILKKGPK